MINDPVFLAIRASREGGVTDAVSFFRWILIKYAALSILSPVLDIHRVRADEFELTKAVITVVGAGSRVNDKVLAGLGVDELLRTFV